MYKLVGLVLVMDARDKEIAKLKTELDFTQQMLKQLADEKVTESYDSRRSTMMKSQIIQLERQCMLLSEALSCRTAVTNQLENELLSLTQVFQTMLADEKSGPSVLMPRKELVKHIRTLQKLQGSLHQQSVDHKLENLSLPLLTYGRADASSSVTCVDVCDPTLKNVNLRNIAKLESDLAALYKNLLSLQAMIEATLPKPGLDGESRNKNAFPEKYLLGNSLRELCDNGRVCAQQLAHCCQELLSVSLLHPSAPWKAIQKPEKFSRFDSTVILDTLPVAMKKRAEVKRIVTSMCKAHNYLMYMNRLQVDVLLEQVRRNAETSKLQSHYMNCLFQGVAGAYKECEQKLKTQVCEPVDEIMRTWFQMKACQTDETLREFLATVKKNENVLEDVVTHRNFLGDESNSECDPLHAFGVELDREIEKVNLNCSEKCAKLKSDLALYRMTNMNEVRDALELLRADGL